MSEPDASASVSHEDFIQERMADPEFARAYRRETMAELDRLARELADAQMLNAAAWKARGLAEDAAEAAEAELARAQAALRDIASCRTRPPADAIEVACRYWAEAAKRDGK